MCIRDSNTFINTLDAVSIQCVGEKIYSIRFRLKDTEEVKKALTTGCRFVFLADWDSYAVPVPGITTIEKLCTAPPAKFEFSQLKTLLSADNLIPMYGVCLLYTSPVTSEETKFTAI